MSVIEDFEHRLAQREVIIVDGGMGSEMQARGFTHDDQAWTGVLALSDFDSLREVHEDFIRAGAEVVITDTFFSTRTMLDRVGLGDRVRDVNRRAVEAAIEARDRVADHPVVVAGSISFSAVLDPLGRHERLEPRAHVTAETALAVYREQVQALAEAGCDVIALEMMLAVDHALPALQAALETGLPVWVGVSAGPINSGGLVTTWRDGVMPEGDDFAELIRTLARPEVGAILVMHTELEDTLAALDVVASLWQGTIGCYPHIGIGDVDGDAGWSFPDLGGRFLEEAKLWVEHGAQLIGGCCGVRPADIAVLAKHLPRHLPDGVRA
jgi:S-methylmethionine-dependent homocysteine/selenocysteine methylase